jgi:hypothetical protein
MRLRIVLTIVFLVLLGCRSHVTQSEGWTKLGVISDFEIYKSGSFNGYDVAVVTLDDGRKVSFRLSGRSLITGYSLYTGKRLWQTTYEVKP